jgi:hypothetical protein
MKLIDLTSQRFGRLVVQNLIGRLTSGRHLWRCRCDCGQEVEVVGHSLKTGNTQSCGCYQRDRAATASRKHRTPPAINKLYNGYRQNAKKKGRVFELGRTEFQFLIQSPCQYCGVKPANGVDRLDSSSGYTSGNCTPCCHFCNRAKGDRTLEEFFSWAKRFSTFTLGSLQ